MPLTLVLGGARSGKSRYAEGLAAKARGAKLYIATAEAIDEEMRERIGKHRRRRGDGWATVEAPLDVVAALRSASAKFILIDCLTVWLGNLLHHGRDVEAEVDRLCAILATARATVVVVSNEVGLGIVPENALARRFRDVHGRANQRLAEVAGEVVLVAAGLPLVLKTGGRGRGGRRTGSTGRGRRS